MFRLFRGKREAIKKALLIIFLSIVSIGMVVTLAPIFPGAEGLEPNVLAEINGVPITSTELSRNVQARLRNSPFGNDPQMMSRMAGIILDDMIFRRALWSEAGKLGISVSDAEVQKNIESTMPFLYPSGQFVGLDGYRDFISRQTGLSVLQFEAQMRDGLLQEKMRSIITDGVRVAPAEVRDEYLKRNTKARIEYALFDPSQYLKAVEVTNAALGEFFQKDPAKYKVPEERRVRYALIDMDRVRAEVKVGESDLKQYYGQHIGEYQVRERVKVSHILFKTEGKTPDEIAATEKKAREVLAEVKAGKDFAELARNHSEDSSAPSGGDIGWIVRGQTVKEFEDSAFNMRPGQVSDLIKTTYGLHIVKVFDKQAAHLQTFEEVRNQIREHLETQQLAEAQHTLASKLEREFQQNAKDFPALAVKNGLEVKETPLFRFNQPVTDLGTSEGFHNLAYQLREGAIGTVSVPKGTAIIQVIQIAPEHAPKLEEVRATVEQDYRAAQSQVLAAQKAREFAARAKSGDFKNVAQSLGVATKESKDFTQQDYIEGVGSGASLAAAFTLPEGQTSDAISVGANHVVFRVVARTAADETGLAGQQDQIAEELLERKRSLAWELYQQSLKDRLKASGRLKTNEAALRTFLAGYQRS
jgi:peptidyl-prolyl cis-trans isomerase D